MHRASINQLANMEDVEAFLILKIALDKLTIYGTYLIRTALNALSILMIMLKAVSLERSLKKLMRLFPSTARALHLVQLFIWEYY
jgi:hypothetical protein